jgi:hypothetical protein
MGNLIGHKGFAAPLDELIAGDAFDVFFENHVGFYALTDFFIGDTDNT